MVEFERRFGGLTMTQQDRSYRGADGVTKPGRLLADRPPESAPSATPVTREHDTGDCASVRQPGYDRGALAMSGPTPSTIAVPDTARCDGAARTKEKLLEHWEQPVGGRNRK
jgi:hypothetical protein